MKYSDKQMVAAVEEARKLKGSKDAEFKSVRDIALKHGVPKSTLHLRLNSGNDAKISSSSISSAVSFGMDRHF